MFEKAIRNGNSFSSDEGVFTVTTNSNSFSDEHPRSMPPWKSSFVEQLKANQAMVSAVSFEVMRVPPSESDLAMDEKLKQKLKLLAKQHRQMYIILFVIACFFLVFFSLLITAIIQDSTRNENCDAWTVSTEKDIELIENLRCSSISEIHISNLDAQRVELVRPNFAFNVTITNSKSIYLEFSFQTISNLIISSCDNCVIKLDAHDINMIRIEKSSNVTLFAPELQEIESIQFRLCYRAFLVARKLKAITKEIQVSKVIYEPEKYPPLRPINSTASSKNHPNPGSRRRRATTNSTKGVIESNSSISDDDVLPDYKAYVMEFESLEYIKEAHLDDCDFILFNMPQLKNASAIFIYNITRGLYFSAEKMILAEYLSVESCNLVYELNFPLLEGVEQDLEIVNNQFDWNHGRAFAECDLQATVLLQLHSLVAVGGRMSISYNLGLTRLELGKLQIVFEKVFLSNNIGLCDIDLGSMIYCSVIQISFHDSLQQVNLSNVIISESTLVLSNANLKALNVNALVISELVVSLNPKLREIGLASYVQGGLSVTNNKDLEQLIVPKLIISQYIAILNNPNLKMAQINVTAIQELVLTDEVIVGNTFYRQMLLSGVTDLPTTISTLQQFNGTGEIGIRIPLSAYAQWSLSLYGGIQEAVDPFSTPLIVYQNNNLQNFRMLEFINNTSGDVIFDNNPLLSTFEMPKLELVYFNLSIINNNNIDSVSLPALKETGEILVENNLILSSVDMPNLEKVNKYLSINNNPELCLTQQNLDKAQPCDRINTQISKLNCPLSYTCVTPQG